MQRQKTWKAWFSRFCSNSRAKRSLITPLDIGKQRQNTHKTRDIFHVQRLLGHRNIQNIAIYITLENSLFQTKDDEFHVAVAKTLDEACKLLEVGFEHIYDMDNVKLFRKRK